MRWDSSHLVFITWMMDIKLKLIILNVTSFANAGEVPLWGTRQPLDGVNCLPEPQLPLVKQVTFIYVKLLTVWGTFRNLFRMALNPPFPFLISAWAMDTLAWVSISDTNYILSLARSYFKLFIWGHSYLCHCQNSSKGPVTLMVGLLEAKGSAVT